MLEASSKILQEITGVREELDNLNGLRKRVEDIKSELDRVDYVARSGRAPAHLVNLLRLKRHFHAKPEEKLSVTYCSASIRERRRNLITWRAAARNRFALRSTTSSTSLCST